MVQDLRRIGSGLAQGWCRVGGLVQDWYRCRIGTGLVQDWQGWGRIGAGFVQDWCRVGAGLVPDWRRTGAGLVQG